MLRTAVATRSTALLLAILLSACGSLSPRDGPGSKPPPDLDKVPDAQPQVEPMREGGPNKPYDVAGQSYSPVKGDPAMSEKGLASWYGRQFHGRRTASGEVYNMYAMTAAHKTMPIPSYARVRNPVNGREIVVRVNDRGPFVKGRIIDLSYTAALKIGALNNLLPVEVERITYEQIRSGAWQRKSGAGGELNDDLASPSDVSPPPATLVPPQTVDEAKQQTPSPSTAFTTAAQGHWVQLGAFKQRDKAEQFQKSVSEDLSWISPLLTIFSEKQLFRLQAGPYRTRNEAQDAAARVREALKLVPVVIERK